MNKRFRYTALLCLGVMLSGVVTPMDSQVSAASTRQMEKLSRGAVAVKVPEGVLRAGACWARKRIRSALICTEGQAR